MQNNVPFSLALPSVTLTTDGGCSPNPGPGAWAYSLRFGTAYKEGSGHASNTTNNRMELEAINQGLMALKKPCRVVIRTDSKVAMAWIQRKIGKKVARENPDLGGIVGRVRALCRLHTVTFEWVRGHTGDQDNERCDQLCSEQMRINRANH